MADLTSLTAASPLASASSSVSSTAATSAVTVTISSLSQALQDITSSIQTPALTTSLSHNNVTLATPLGDITVSLSNLPAALQQDLLKQLSALLQSQKNIVLSLQPGAPTQAVLWLPLTSNQTAAPPQTSTAPQTSPSVSQPASVGTQTSALPVSFSTALVGTTITAIVLPPSAVSAAPLTVTVPGGVPVPLTPTVAAPASVPVPSTFFALPPGGTLMPMAEAAPPLNVPPVTVLPTSATHLQLAPVLNTAQNISEDTPSQNTLLRAVVPAPATTTAVPSSAQTPNVQTLSPVPDVTPALSQALKGASPQLIQLLQNGGDAVLRIDAVLPAAGGQGVLSLPPLKLDQMIVTVTSSFADGKALAQSQDSVLVLKFAGAAPPNGSRLLVTIEPAQATPLLPLPLPQISTTLPALSQLTAALAQLNPGLVSQLASENLPQPNTGLPAALFFLFKAFRQGDAQTWVGPRMTTALSQIGKSELLSVLSREFEGAPQVTKDAVVGEWKSFPIPLFIGNQFQTLGLYVHQDAAQNKKQSSNPSDSDVGERQGNVRFLIDMRLSKLGALQLDGLVKPKHIDMILRSEARLPDGLHDQLRTAYIAAMESVGFTGMLKFQLGREHWLSMRTPKQHGLVT